MREFSSLGLYVGQIMKAPVGWVREADHRPDSVSDGGEVDLAYSGVALASVAFTTGSVVSVGVWFKPVAGGARGGTVDLLP